MPTSACAAIAGGTATEDAALDARADRLLDVAGELRLRTAHHVVVRRPSDRRRA